MPTVCKITLDAEEYRKELNKVVSDTKIASHDLSGNLSGKAKITGMNEVKELSSVAGNLPEEKTIKIDVSNDAALQIDKTKKGFGSLTVPVQSFTQKAANGFRNIWKEMTNVQGAAKKVGSILGGGGGLLGIAIAGGAGAIKAGIAIYDSWVQKTRDAAESASRNAEEIKSVAEANDAMRQKTTESMNTLQNLASKEKLSNIEKNEALRLIKDLRKSYGDLGITLDSTTGKLRGVDSAMTAKLKKDKNNALREINAELNDLKTAKGYEEQMRDTAGFSGCIISLIHQAFHF